MRILRRGFFFVDSPGLGSATTQNTRTTETFLPEADALLMVSGYDGALSDDEVRVLRLFSRSHRRVFFVLNKQDTVSRDERQVVCADVRGPLRKIWGREPPHIFSLSAVEGLRAKMTGDSRVLEGSGLADFERELTHFLLEKKGGEFIQGACDRVAHALAALKESTGRSALLERVVAVRGAKDRYISGSNAAEKLTVDIKGGPRTWSTCELCTAIQQRLFEFLAQYQHELATFPEASRSLAQTGGLCGPHLRLYASLAAERDLCVALTPLLTRWVQQLRSDPPGLVARGPNCRLCDLQESVEITLIDQWQGTEETSATVGNREVCAPHLQKLGRV